MAELGEVKRPQLLAALIKRDDPRIGSNRNRLSADVGEFGDHKRPGHPLGVTLNQISLGSAPDLSSGNDMEFQAAPEGPSPNAHMRSRL